jgi:hypothetical protein
VSIYQCEKCGCAENTACGHYHCRDWQEWPEEYRGKKLCSACGPPQYSDGTPTRLGKWHGRFERTYYPLGSMETDGNGNLREKVKP